MDVSQKIIITAVLILSYLWLKFMFPLVVGFFKRTFQSKLQSSAGKAPDFFNLFDRLPDALGVFMLLIIIFIWASGIH